MLVYDVPFAIHWKGFAKAPILAAVQSPKTLPTRKIRYAAHVENDSKLTAAYRAFDAANAEDPNHIIIDGEAVPKELTYARRLTDAVLALDPAASEPLRLAARCQHIRRWQVPRNTQPMGRAGYLKWREGLKHFHAEQAAEILHDVGYDVTTLSRVVDLNLKKNIKTDPDCQTLEDALCLVFLKHQFADLVAETESEKMIRIVKKTWSKMSPRGHEAALALDYSPECQRVLDEALAE